MKIWTAGMYLWLGMSACLGCAGSALGAVPVLFFTDLESGPKTGGENNNGAFVTLYGNYFGGNPAVTVGGGQALIKLPPAPHLWYQKLVIQLGPAAATGNLVVSTAEGISNGLPFTVRSGTIRFVGTQPGDLSSIVACKNVMTAGDIGYVREGMDQTGIEDYNASLCACTPGNAGSPVALAAYPGAAVTIGDGTVNYGVRTPSTSGCSSRNYWVLAGFKLRSGNAALDLLGVNNWRVIGNDISCPNGAGQSAALHTDTTTDSYFFGNYEHDSGVTPTDKYYHRFYFTTNTNNVEVAWNEITGGGANRAVQFYSTGGSDQFGLSVHDNYLHDIVGDGINFATVNAGNGRVEAYNNLIVRVGLGPDPYNGQSNYAGFLIGGTSAGTVEIYNNTLYDCGAWASPDSGGIAAYVPTRLRNNIVNSLGSESYLAPNAGGSMLAGSNNLWFGKSNGPSQTAGNLNADPEFVSAGGNDFHLQDTSPARDAGVGIAALAYDLEGKARGAQPDLGAYEYGASSSAGPPASPRGLKIK